MVALPNGNYLLSTLSNNNAGFEKLENSMGDHDLWLIMISPTRTVIKEKTIGGEGFDAANSMFVRTDGSILLAGMNGSKQGVDKRAGLNGNYDAWILNVDDNLNIIWSEKIGGSILDPNPFVELFSRFIYEGNDVFTFVGYSSESKGNRAESFGGVDGWVVKMKIPLATKPTITSPNAIVCTGDAITLTTNGCMSDILWSNGLTTPSVVVKPNSADNTFYVTCKTSDCIAIQSDIYKPMVADANQNLTGVATSGIVQSKQTITSRQTIQPNANVNYRAGKYILLEKNQSFEAKNGSIFKAEIAVCNLDAGLQGYYTFNNNAQDQSGNSRNGTIANGALFTKDRFGNSNAALQFNGSNQYVTFGNWMNYQEFTVSYWVRAGVTQANAYANLIENNHTGTRSWVSQQNNTSNNIYDFGVNNDTGGGAGVQFRLEPNVWNHMVYIKGSNYVKVYKNGVLLGNNPFTGTIPYDGTQQLIMAAWHNTGTIQRFWNGHMDDFRIYNRPLTDTEAITLFKSEAPMPNFTSDQFLNMKLDGNANDESGNGNNGTTSGGPTYTTDRFGQANKAMNFDGVDDFVEIANNNSLSGFNEVTLSAWISHNQTSSFGSVISKWHQSVSQDTYAMEINTSTLIAASSGAPASPISSPILIPINTWTHIVYTHDAIGDRLYINGNQVISNTNGGNIIVSPQKLNIGAALNGATIWRYFKGIIDDVKGFSRALTPLEVIQLYELEKP